MAKSDKPILILGETGVGKSKLAKKIHKESQKNGFIHLNIPSLNQNTVESELFGHERGSFTGAVGTGVGFFESTKAGTLFIDEIGDLSLSVQAKILTVIDENLFYRVGSTLPKKFMGRLIFATNKNLEELVQQGKFREDLFYRIRFYQIELAPLRKRSNMLTILMQEIQNTGLSYSRSFVMDEDVLDLLIAYSWPGNFRELKNTVEFLYLLNKQRIRISDLPSWIFNHEKENASTMMRNRPYYDAMENFERNYLKKALITYSGGVNKTAQAIGISKVTLISKLKKYGIDRRIYKNLEKIKTANEF